MLETYFNSQSNLKRFGINRNCCLNNKNIVLCKCVPKDSTLKHSTTFQNVYFNISKYSSKFHYNP